MIVKYRFPTHTLQSILDHGEDGWELVTIDGGILYFKRPKK